MDGFGPVGNRFTTKVTKSTKARGDVRHPARARFVFFVTFVVDLPPAGNKKPAALPDAGRSDTP